MLSVGVVSRYESILIVVIPHQGQDIAAALLDTFVAPALAAYGHVSVVSADFDLGTLADKIALSVYACVDDGLRPQLHVDLTSSMVSAISKRRREPSNRWLWKSVRSP